ncbi:MAG: aminoacyl--tRNA ligase-related protein, partial [Phycisphaerae bacterium]
MLDIKFIRESPDAVRRGAQAKNIPVELDRLLELDAHRRSLQTRLQAITTEQNQISRDIGPLMGQLKKLTDPAAKAELESRAGALRQKSTELKAQAAELEDQIHQLDPQIDAILLTIPQPPDEDVPAGKSSDDNVELRRWGTVPTFDFTPQSHVDLGRKLKLFDVERGVKLAGSRSYFLTGAGAMLHQAVLRLAMDMMVHEKGFTPMVVPVLVKEAAMRGTGFFPAGREQAYRVGEINETGDDERYLTGTGEVGLTAMYMDEILDHSQLPLKLVTKSTCFRREAGTYGKDTTGLYRIHQFDKVEQVIICRADRNESIEWHKNILANSEAILQRLELP